MGSKVKIRFGNIFDDQSDLIILPCSTGGTITNFVSDYLRKYNIPKPQPGMRLGHLSIQPFNGAEITQFVGFGVSVEHHTSTLAAINRIGMQIGEFTLSEPSVRLIAAPLLGAGAGGLGSENVVKELQKGYLSTAHPDSTLTINILHKNIFERVVKNLKAIDINKESHESINKKTLQVFLCHSSKDKKLVRELYNKRCQDGISPWLDEESLLPGQDWQQEIRKAVNNSDVFIACLSKEAINKKGYIQKEINYALNVAEEQPEGAIFLIPLKLEECNIPERLSRWHWVNYFEDKGYGRLMRSLRFRANELGLRFQKEILYDSPNNLIYYDNKSISNQ
jgi:hypothetical protein